LQASKMQRG